jgi:hypothetical protein
VNLLLKSGFFFYSQRVKIKKSCSFLALIPFFPDALLILSRNFGHKDKRFFSSLFFSALAAYFDLREREAAKKVNESEVIQ